MNDFINLLGLAIVLVPSCIMFYLVARLLWAIIKRLERN